MSLAMNHIRAMVENSTGYYGDGSYYDNHPYLTLAECIQAAANDSYALEMEFNESTRNLNNMIVEATYAALTEGATLDYTAINEATKEGLIEKIKKLFGRIREWIASIISKLKEKFKKTKEFAENAWEKYKDHPGVKRPNKDAKYTGYEMKEAAAFKTDPSSKDFEAIALNSPNEDPSGANERKAKIASELSGISGLSAGDWQAELNKKVFGEKKELKYGEGMFNVDTIKKILLNNDGGSQIIKQYENADKKFKDAEAKMLQQVQKYNAANNNDQDELPTYEAATMIYSEISNVLNALNNIATNYQTTRIQQANGMLSALVAATTEDAKKYAETLPGDNTDKKTHGNRFDPTTGQVVYGESVDFEFDLGI